MICRYVTTTQKYPQTTEVHDRILNVRYLIINSKLFNSNVSYFIFIWSQCKNQNLKFIEEENSEGKILNQKEFEVENKKIMK